MAAIGEDRLAPLVDAIRSNLGRKATKLSTDAGYSSEANLRTLAKRRINAYIATGRQRHGTAAAVAERRPHSCGIVARMANKLKRAGRRGRYRFRKQLVEPVFGQIKHARGFRQFLLRGLDKVKAERALLYAVHNLLKLAAAA